MPQILSQLGLDAEDPAALDFGTIAVYRRAKARRGNAFVRCRAAMESE